MINPDTRHRHAGLVRLDQLTTPITLIGAGSIGSYTALYLTKLGCSNLTVYDPDIVTDTNVGCQLYGSKHIGAYKVEALQGILDGLTDIIITPISELWNGVCTPIVISAVDSMEARREIWEQLEGVRWLVDGRMAGEYLHIYTIDMENDKAVRNYEKSLQGKEQEELGCSVRSVVYNTSIVGGLITKQIKTIAIGGTPPREIIFDLAGMDLVKF